jgi:hypothetical protein
MIYSKNKKGLITLTTKNLVLVTLLLLLSAFVSITPVSASIDITAEKHTGITIDGLTGDWTGIPSTSITLIQPFTTSQRITDGLEIKTTFDDSNIYVLVTISDDYDYNVTDHYKSAAIAVLFAIDDEATPDMGGGNGYVDIWHWELDVGPGVVTGYNVLSGNDPIGNLDDEYSLTVFDRHDDQFANEVYGAWSHTNMSAVGADGKWVFEFKRSLTTMGTLNQDIQFEIGKTYKMAIAYWDADELGEPGVQNGWTAPGHYSSCTNPDTLEFSWINLALTTPVIPQGPQGETGPQGTQGPQGETGPQGLPGSAGTDDWTTYLSAGSIVLAIIAIAIAYSKR